MSAPTLDPTETRVDVAPSVAVRTRSWAPSGPGADPAFVAVHGLASSAVAWTGVARALAAAGHHVVAVDLRGHGGSDAPDHGHGTATAAADVAAVVGALGLDHPVVVGQSWGGEVALHLAGSRPDVVRGVAAVDGGVIDLPRRYGDWEACRAALTPPETAGMRLGQVERWLFDAHPDWPVEHVEWLLGSWWVRADRTVVPYLSLEHHMAILRDLWDHPAPLRWAAATAPVLLLPVLARDDPDAEAKRAAHDEAVRALRRAEVSWFQPAEHDVHVQYPEAVADVLLSAVRDGAFSGVAP